jgi:hypothetical protein
MQRSAVEAVAGRGREAGRRHADTVKGMYGRRDLAVGVGAEDARPVGSSREMVDMGFWMLEVAGPGRSERSGSYQDLLVAAQAVLVVKRRMDSDGRKCACLAPRDRIAEGFPGKARDGKLATHFDACHGPSGMLGHGSHDGTQVVHLRQIHPANQRKDAEGRTRAPPAFHNDHSRPSDKPTTETFPWAHACHVLPPCGRAIPLSCAMYPADLFVLKTRQRPVVVVCSAAVEHLTVAMASGLVVLAMAVQWRGEWAR